MTYDELKELSGFGEQDFLSKSVEIESAMMVENINGDGSLTLSWKSDTGGIIPAGTTLGNYVMLDTYAPSRDSDGIYQWSPRFSDIVSVLGRTLFYKSAETTDGGNMTLYNFMYAGPAKTLINDMNTFLKSLDGGWSVEASDDLMKDEKGITVSFDGDTIKSAAGKIADACGTNIYYVGKKICIGMSNAYAADEYYNRFVVLGGTKNMAKKTTKGGYSAITQRLTIDDNGSIISSGIGPSMTKMLIFDDIYPKMELVITSARYRLCYLLDENGEKISDGSGGYKQYAKWYVKLGIQNEDGTTSSYPFNSNIIIQGKPLGMLFQSGPLTGREFELSYFDKSVTEKEQDDVEISGFQVKEGEYRIIMQADGDTLLPSLPADGTGGYGGLCPAVGHIVTMTNVALDDVYVTAARKKLKERGEKVASIYSSGKIASYTEQRSLVDFLSGKSEKAAELGSHDNRFAPDGDDGDGYIVTSISTDLITGQQTVTYGTFTPKGILSSLSDKVESISLSGGGTTNGEDYRGPSPMNIDQLKALQRAGGNLGMITVNEKFKESQDQYQELESSFREVKKQADSQFNIWFGDYAPLPNLDIQNASGNYPADEWTTMSLKKMHLQDLFYDTSKNVSDGGRVWRWVNDEADGIEYYFWQEVTDAETLATLERLSDIKSDGIICGGAEKTRVLIEWNKVRGEYAHLEYYATTYGLDQDDFYGTDEEGNQKENIYKTYSDSFHELANMLNGGEEWNGESVPVWLSDLTEDTVIVPSADVYREKWDSYHVNHARISSLVSAESKETAAAALNGLRRMADDDMLTAAEKKNVAREYDKIVCEVSELVAQAEENGLSEDEGSVLYQYRKAYTYLWFCLDNPTIEPIIVFTDTLDNHERPAILYDGKDTAIVGDYFCDVWKKYYQASEELRRALSTVQTRVFVSVGLPSPPYKRGDLWRKLDTDEDTSGKMMVCIVGKSKDEEPQLSDWDDFVTIDQKEPRMIISLLIEKILPYYDFPDVMSLHLTSTEGATIGDLCQSGGKVYKANGGDSFSEITGDSTLAESFLSAYASTGDEVIVVYSNERPAAASRYDVYLRKISYKIATTGERIEGGVEVSMFGDSGWEIISRPTSGIIENLGSMVRLLVFGSAECENVDAAGIMTSKNFVNILAQTEDSSGKTLAESYLHLEVLRDEKGNPTGLAKMKADEIDFETGTFKLKANLIDFAGTDVDMSAADKINLNAKSVNLNADKITYNGIDVISNNEEMTTFGVDENGNITINKALVNCAEINTAEINSATIKRTRIDATLQSPFVNCQRSTYDENGVYYQAPQVKDNVYYQWESGEIQLNWSTLDSGRRITIIQGKDCNGNCTIVTPSSDMRFFENGIEKSKLTISNQMLVLKGYGTDETFFGYIVESRTDVVSLYSYGSVSKVLCKGFVNYHLNETGHFSETELTVRTFDGNAPVLDKIGTGIFTLTLPDSWNIPIEELHVQATGYGRAFNGTNPCFVNCSVISYEEGPQGFVRKIKFMVTQGSSVVDGSFFFEISNMGDFKLV